ncbi:hypothetical protein J1N35_040032 [Gossypium stocksii]|uniref:Uncharacterized protein n=1 Tax=Gossypium stocksii TaxID=47602 RepID=A0A9D3UDF2_9ROSI|nr:hypothetical protein J1N35_040032 [Gossypium stocksii]
MGFWDLHFFNLALLAKQGWRLIHNKNSLCHKVFKVKYFLNCSFMEAKIGCNPPLSFGEAFGTTKLFFIKVLDGLLEMVSPNELKNKFGFQPN